MRAVRVKRNRHAMGVKTGFRTSNWALVRGKAFLKVIVSIYHVGSGRNFTITAVLAPRTLIVLGPCSHVVYLKLSGEFLGYIYSHYTLNIL